MHVTLAMLNQNFFHFYNCLIDFYTLFIKIIGKGKSKSSIFKLNIQPDVMQ